MKKTSVVMFVFLVVLVCGFQAASAQITINIPNFPKIKKDKAEKPSSPVSGSSASYDKDAFNAVKWGNNDYIVPYLACYAKKHSLELYSVTGDAYRPPNYRKTADVNELLKPDLPKLAEIETLLKSKMPSRPNTGKNYYDNPAIWDEITTGREEYFQCVLAETSANAATNNPRLGTYREEIADKQKEVDSYTPDRDYFVYSVHTDDLLLAVSQRERSKWMSDQLELKPILDPLLDALAASAAKKLPLYKTNPVYYKFRDAVAEKLLMNYFKDPSTIKVHRIGLARALWDIQKDNYGLPSYRYKFANVYYRDSSDDHPYCRVASVRIKQDYAGGGTYNAQMYRSSADVALAGCPAGQ